MNQKSNPFVKPMTEEKDAAQAATLPANSDPTEQTGEVQEQGDTETEERYPVENGAVRWDDAANEGDISREKQAVYDTPWGRRELSATEVTDFGVQGVTVTRVDDVPRTSLDAEREELRKVELTNRNTNTPPAQTGDR